MIYGIQGGKGSFNEEALSKYLRNSNINSVQVNYLYTTEKVLRALDSKDIDFGLFAIQNSVGGLVEESIYAMSGHTFEIVEKISIPIRHFLMKRKDTESVHSIMAHPQVLKQCKSTLSDKYSHLKLTSGDGDLLDTAKAAEALTHGDLPENIAILGPKGLSELYNLDIIAENLQDDKTNITDFLLVNKFL